MKINIVTFNDAEASAVREYLADLANLHGWHVSGASARGVRARIEHIVEHKSLRAQGNLSAASELASVFRPEESHPDLLLFFGCCGSIDEKLVGHAFLVKHVHYMALGKVETAILNESHEGKVAQTIGERVTLKSKWLIPTATAVLPHRFTSFDSALLDPLSKKTQIRTAVAIATEAVIRVAPSNSVPLETGDDEWSYSEGIRYLKERARSKFRDLPIVVDMESQGIATFANQLDVQSQVLVLRVVTDSLTNKDRLNQPNLLMDGRVHLQKLIETILQEKEMGIGQAASASGPTENKLEPATKIIEKEQSETRSYIDGVLNSFRSTQPNWLCKIEYRGDWSFNSHESKWRPRRTNPVSAASAFIKYCASTGRVLGLGGRVDETVPLLDFMIQGNESLMSVLQCFANYDSVAPGSKIAWIRDFSLALQSDDDLSILGPLLNLAIEDFLIRIRNGSPDSSLRDLGFSWPTPQLNEESQTQLNVTLLAPTADRDDAILELDRRKWLEKVVERCGARIIQMTSAK